MKDNTKIRLRLSKQLFESIAAEVISEAKKHDMSGGAYTEAVKMPKKAKELDEANLSHNEISSIHQEGSHWIVTYRTADGKKEKSFKSEKEARNFYNSLDESGTDYSTVNEAFPTLGREKIQEIEPVTATLAAVGSALTAAAVYDIAKIMKTQNLTGIKGFIKAAKQLRRSDTNPMTGGDVN